MSVLSRIAAVLLVAAGSLYTADISNPFFTDIDADGDQDLLLGNPTGSSGTGETKDGWKLMSTRYNSLQTFSGITVYRNTGSDSAAVFHLADTTLARGIAPAAADMDGDGDADLLIGTAGGNITYYRSDNMGGKQVYTLVDTTYFNITVGAGCHPFPADLDGDGDIDLLTGRADGRIGYYRNDGSASSPYLALVDSQFYNIDVGTGSAPSLVDIDNDGDLDLMIGSGAGLLAYYRNDGTALSPTFVKVDSAYFAIDADAGLTPAWADLDADGDYDLYTGSAAGVLRVYRNTGTPSSAYFTNAPAAYDFALTAPVDTVNPNFGRNLLTNPGAEAGTMSGWTITRTGGDGFRVAGSGSAHEGTKIFQSSYNLSTRQQLIDLVAEGFSTAALDAAPEVYVGEWFRANLPSNGNDKYNITVSLQSSPTGGVLDSWSVNTVTSGSGWNEQSHVFSGYGPGLRYILFQDGADDAEFWAGYYGPELDDAFVKVGLGAGAPGAGTHAAPVLADLDSDGDNDLLMGGSGGNLVYYRNDGSAAQPVWAAPDTAYGGIRTGTYSVPALADVDNDNDLDLFVGKADGRLSFYRNDGSASAPVWTLVDSGYFNIDAGSHSMPVLTDIDADGDQDLMVGNAGGTLHFYENRGTAAAPLFVLTDAAYAGIDVGTYSAPAFADPDSNGVMDLFIGTGTGAVYAWYNHGTADSAVFSLVDAAYADLDAGSRCIPSFGDLDGDGDADLLLGRSDGYLSWYLNEGAGAELVPDWGQAAAGYLGIDIGSNSVPAWVDIDGDGDQDLFVGTGTGRLHYYRNDGTATAPACTLISSFYDSISTGSNAYPAFADYDGDGDQDLFLGKSDGTISLYRNDGTALSPSWALLDAMYFNIDAGSNSAPVLADIDADGDYDLFIGNAAGTIHFYRNEGAAQSPYWRLESSSYFSIDAGSNSIPAFTDIDGDGDLDLFVGNAIGQMYSYTNDSTAQNAGFVSDQTMYNNIDVGSNAAPVFTDIDADGRTDLFVGNAAGTIDHWEMIHEIVSILDPEPARNELVPSGLPAGMYDLFGRRIYGQPVRPGVYLLVPEDGSGIVKKVLNP